VFKMSEELEIICFQIISNSGSAKSNYIEAIQKAKAKEYDEANRLMEEAEEYFLKAHKIHSELIQKEACGEKTEFSILLMHSEDQMSSTELSKILAQEVIELHKELNSIKN